MYPNVGLMYLAEIQSHSNDYFLVSQSVNYYGRKEDKIPDIMIPSSLEVNVKVDFWEEWVFGLELTPQGGTYFNKNSGKSAYIDSQ